LRSERQAEREEARSGQISQTVRTPLSSFQIST
jgi:hypothetical protein